MAGMDATEDTAATPIIHLLHPTIHTTKESNVEKLKLDLVAFGWALSSLLIVLLALCEVTQMFLPGWQLAHNWLGLFSTAEVGSLRNLFDGVIASAIGGWIMAAVLVTVYNRLITR